VLTKNDILYFIDTVFYLTDEFWLGLQAQYFVFQTQELLLSGNIEILSSLAQHYYRAKKHPVHEQSLCRAIGINGPLYIYINTFYIKKTSPKHPSPNIKFSIKTSECTTFSHPCNFIHIDNKTFK